MAGFEPGPANPQPMSVGFHTRPAFNVIELLPPGGADRLRTLRQHVSDLHSLTTPFAELQEANTAKLEAAHQLKRLTDHQQHGGFNLKSDDPRVIAAQARLDTLSADYRRLTERNEGRSTAWREAGQTLAAVEQWLRDGRPPNTTLQDFDGKPPSLAKSEIVTDAIERLRRRGRELRADQRRVQSAPYPSSYCKQRAKEQIEALAQRGAPDVSLLIEHDGNVEFPTRSVQSMIYNTGTPAIAFAEVPDVAWVAWLHKDALIKAVCAEIAAHSDDAAALSHAERQKREAEVMGDLLSVERDEAALVWRAMGEQLPVMHRADCSPLAILQCMLVTAPRANGSPGSSPEHAGTVGYGKR
jgi:hypothetical protein